MTNVEQLIIEIPDYKCRDNGSTFVVVDVTYKDGKVLNTTIRHGHAKSRDNE